MKYLIIGAGGTGGVVGFHMAQAGKDVTLIARDAHLESIQQKGLTLQTMWDENTKTIPVKASDMQHYKDRPDVILVCVKGYSLDGIYEFIRRIAKPQTIVSKNNVSNCFLCRLNKPSRQPLLPPQVDNNT